MTPSPGFQPRWFKSSYSGGNTTECVETSFVSSGVLVRDSKRPGDPPLAFSAGAWSRFIARARHGLHQNLRTEEPKVSSRRRLRARN
ncbi:DUF397 domain-containing protein [Streptomyces sp. NBC_01352]|uniref:DUF397 domain-containing protein n=1 Tax=Streptomyces sp. NBC_01352 TaxID=2903834 RepID=UPI002E326ACF|nr:DUF397 domain-containing protein [Streptomyces sp. NBC_01352]